MRHKYDPEGKRIEKVVVKAGKSKTVKYLRLGSEIAMEVDEKGDVISRNVNGTAPISREMDGNKYFLLYNGEGDVTALVDRSGMVAERYAYDAFGNVTKSVDGSGKSLGMGESKNPVRYKGYEYDEETKLYYLNARMYDPSIARFIQEDTYRGDLKDPLSLNLYTYCHNNPLVYSDPTGHKPIVAPTGDYNWKKAQAAPKPTPKSTPKPAPKPTLNEKIRAGDATIKDIAKMNNSQLMSTIVRSGSDYSSASAKEKKELHALAEAARMELLRDNKGNELITAYVKGGNVKGAVAVTNKGNVKLDAVTISNLINIGTSDDYDVRTVVTANTTKAVVTKPTSKPDVNQTTKSEGKPANSGMGAVSNAATLINKVNGIFVELAITTNQSKVQRAANTVFGPLPYLPGMSDTTKRIDDALSSGVTGVKALTGAKTVSEGKAILSSVQTVSKISNVAGTLGTVITPFTELDTSMKLFEKDLAFIGENGTKTQAGEALFYATTAAVTDAASWGMIRSVVKTPSALVKLIPGEDPAWTNTYDAAVNETLNSVNVDKRVVEPMIEKIIK